MNYMPKIDRRSFLVGTAAVGGGLSLGFAVPFGADTALAQSGTPELNAWVVVRPDDTVVIRIARAEMGQGSQTGLAQLVAEELECDWSKVTTEIPTPGENVARKRVWGNFNSSGSRAIREFAGICAQGRCGCARNAPAGRGQPMERAGFRARGRQGGDHAQSFEPQHDLRQGRGGRCQARTADGRKAQGSEGLDNHRQATQAAGYRRQGDGQAKVFDRLHDAGNALRGHEGVPGIWRQDQELRRRENHRTCRASRRSCSPAMPRWRW